MEERLYQGNAAMPMNTAVAPNARQNNETMQNNRIKGPAPMATGVPNGANMPAPPPLPKNENMPMMPVASTFTMPNSRNMPYIPEKPNKAEPNVCGYKSGELPACAPLAAGYVPYQQKNPPKYGTDDALTHGTLFPGLDLPFMNTANKNNPYAGTPLGELMAIDFAIHELVLYLDTHKDDKDAYEMQKTLIAMSKEGRRKYEKRYGPIGIMDVENAGRYEWLKDPWPWEYAERTGK